MSLRFVLAGDIALHSIQSCQNRGDSALGRIVGSHVAVNVRGGVRLGGLIAFKCTACAVP